MDEDLSEAAKFKLISTIIFIVFFIFTIILIPTLSIYLGNYWLFFGVAFSFLGYIVKELKPEKIFFVVTIAVVIYWLKVRFYFFDLITFFWFSFLFGSIFKGIIIVYDNLSSRIIDIKASDMTSQIINGIKQQRDNQIDE